MVGVSREGRRGPLRPDACERLRDVTRRRLEQRAVLRLHEQLREMLSKERDGLGRRQRGRELERVRREPEAPLKSRRSLDRIQSLSRWSESARSAITRDAGGIPGCAGSSRVKTMSPSRTLFTRQLIW